MNSIEKSELVAARILNWLLDFGIKLGHLDSDDLQLDDEFQDYKARVFQWLVDEGLIRAASFEVTLNGDFVAASPCITSYGFRVMGRPISVGGNELTIRQAVRNASDSGAGYSNAGNFMGGLLGSFTKSVSS